MRFAPRGCNVNLKQIVAAAAIASAFGFLPVGLGAGGVANAYPMSPVAPATPLPQDGGDWWGGGHGHGHWGHGWGHGWGRGWGRGWGPGWGGPWYGPGYGPGVYACLSVTGLYVSGSACI